MSGDGSPPSSWYDPPEPKFDPEIKHEEPATPGETCDKCEEDAYMLVSVADVRDKAGGVVTVCKNHYDTILDDTVEEWQNSEPDYDEED